MNARERFLAAIDHKPVDRIPTDIWATQEVWDKLHAHFGAETDVRDALEIDGVAGVAAEYAGPAPPDAPEGESVDFWGIRRKATPHAGGVYHEPLPGPLARAESVEDLDAYRWPDPDWFDYSKMRATAAKARGARAVKCGYMAPFYYHNLLRGLEQSLVDPLEDPDLTHEIIRRIGEFFYEYHRRMFSACDGLIDLAEVTDDLGSQTGPLIGLDIYREFYAPWHRRFIGLCREFGIRIFHHDDGACRIFLPLLVEMGIDVLNPIQWRCPGMDRNELKAEFGGRLCFHGAVDNQQVLPFGTPDEVRAEVRQCIDTLGGDGTGYILASCHCLQGNTPLENILAMYDEARRYGKR